MVYIPPGWVLVWCMTCQENHRFDYNGKKSYVSRSCAQRYSVQTIAMWYSIDDTDHKRAYLLLPPGRSRREHG